MNADPELCYLGAVEAVNGFREGSGAEVNLLDRNLDVRGAACGCPVVVSKLADVSRGRHLEVVDENGRGS